MARSKAVQMPIQMPKFRNESDEANWWASAEGRAYLLGDHPKPATHDHLKTGHLQTPGH
jgi:hypothetical protein